MELVHCPLCDTLNPPGSSFCQQCQKPLPTGTDEVSPALYEAPVTGAEAPASGDEESPAVKEESPAVEEAPATGKQEPAAPETAKPPPLEAGADVLAKVEELKRNIAHKPDAKALYLQLSQIYLDAGRRDLAIATHEQLLDVDPTNVYIRHRLDQLKRPPSQRPSASTPRTARRYPRRPPAGKLDRARELIKRRPKLSAVTVVAVCGLIIAGAYLLFPSTRRIVAGDFAASDAKWSPTGEYLAFLIQRSTGTELGVYDMQSSSYSIVGDVQGWGASAFDWSPNGLRIAYVSQPDDGEWQETISVADILSGETRVVAPGSEPVWYVDESTLLVRCPPQPLSYADIGSEVRTSLSVGLCRVDAMTGQTQWAVDLDAWKMSYTAALNKIAFERISITEDGEYTDLDQEFRELYGAVAAAEPDTVGEGSRDLARELEARRYLEEKRAGAGAESPVQSDIFVMSMDGGGTTQLTSGGRSSLISWTPDGRRVLCATTDSAGTEVWTVNPDGSDRRTVIDASLEPVQLSSVQITQDGSWALFVSRVEADEGVAKVMTGESPADIHAVRIGSSAARRLTNEHPFKQRFAISPAGRLLAYEVLTDVKLFRGQLRQELWLMSW